MELSFELLSQESELCFLFRRDLQLALCCFFCRSVSCEFFVAIVFELLLELSFELLSQESELCFCLKETCFEAACFVFFLQKCLQ